MIIYIGVDDTDILGSAGTGRVARGLANRLVELGLGKSLGVSRHQLLVDSRIRYTSHNSSKGLAIETTHTVSDLYTPTVEYMHSIFVAGSDPGICLCPEDKINTEILEWGNAAVSRVLTKKGAKMIARKSGVLLEELGGDGGGVIGALASVGLRAGGNEGRLVDLRGIHDIKGVLSVRELKHRTDIIAVQDEEGHNLRGDEMIDSQDRIRPALIGGKPVLRVQSQKNPQGLWIPVDTKMHGKEEAKNVV